MLKKIGRKNALSIFSLKVLYKYAKAFGMVCFTITENGFLKFSKKLWVFSVVYWIICTVSYMCLLSYVYRDVFETPSFIRGITFLQYSVKAVFTAAFIKFQLEHHKQFLDAVNRMIVTLIHIAVITDELEICGPEFYSIILAQVLTTILIFITDAPNLQSVYESGDPAFVVQNALGYILVIGTLLTLDVVCLVFITLSRMYSSLGKHVIKFAERIKKINNSPATLGQKKLMFQELCVEFEECSKIYSDIFKITNTFHAMLQPITFFNFNFTITCVIAGVHVCFVNYMIFGQIKWFVLAQRTIQLMNFLIQVFCVDLMVRRSKIPQNLDWESLCSQFDEQWDKCIYEFLAQMRIEDLKIDVYGLFLLNRELSLQVFSMIVGYLTILIQFSMMGYFKEDP